jgi:hypothetical protein
VMVFFFLLFGKQDSIHFIDFDLVSVKGALFKPWLFSHIDTLPYLN